MKIEVSNGEILDKITILLIKKEKITDKKKLINVLRELKELEFFLEEVNYTNDEKVKALFDSLKEINEKLWNIEDRIREKESLHQFDDEFINLARSVYFTNDLRAEVKREINQYTNSSLIEEKSYNKYND